MDRNELIIAYQRVLDGERRYLPRGIWDDKQLGEENFKILFNYLVNDYLQLNEEDVIRTVDRYFFEEYSLRGGLISLFGEDIYKAMDIYYERTVPRWKFKHVPKNYWNENSVDDVVKEIASECGIKSVEDLYKMTKRDMDINGMNKISRALCHKPYSMGTIAKLLFPDQPYDYRKFKTNQKLNLYLSQNN